MFASEFDPKNFGLQKDRLYEIIATGFNKDEKNNLIFANASCMGIRLLDDNLIKITPFHKTTTHGILESMKQIAINFVEEIDIFAYAALKQYKEDLEGKEESKADIEEDKKEPEAPLNVVQGFPVSHISTHKFLTRPIPNAPYVEKILPYINKAWGVLFCKAIDEEVFYKRDEYGRTAYSEFILEVQAYNKIKDSYKIFNRAEHLVLEMIILATRLKIAKRRNDLSTFDENKKKIDEYMKIVSPFCQNKQALKAIDIVSEFVRDLSDEP